MEHLEVFATWWCW